jgi:hypothetical protein
MSEGRRVNCSFFGPVVLEKMVFKNIFSFVNTRKTVSPIVALTPAVKLSV